MFGAGGVKLAALWAEHLIVAVLLFDTINVEHSCTALEKIEVALKVCIVFIALRARFHLFVIVKRPSANSFGTRDLGGRERFDVTIVALAKNNATVFASAAINGADFVNAQAR